MKLAVNYFELLDAGLDGADGGPLDGPLLANARTI
jgi:hypothetical protein